ncbi:14227_t:CDS:2, partial [Ambispora leptoticha]
TLRPLNNPNLRTLSSSDNTGARKIGVCTVNHEFHNKSDLSTKVPEVINLTKFVSPGEYPPPTIMFGESFTTRKN